jgi:Uma2 family endonuclease
MSGRANTTTPTAWDYGAYAAIPSDGQRHEILEGEHFVNPAPNLYHQQISRRIQFQLYSQIELKELGVVINAPVDVQLSNRDIVQPDLVIVTRQQQHIMTPIKVKGIPDLLIEILSPANPDHDLKTKRRVYEQCGVPEYWIVLPEEHSVLQLILSDGKYSEQEASESITMAVAPHVTVDLRKVW